MPLIANWRDGSSDLMVLRQTSTAPAKWSDGQSGVDGFDKEPTTGSILWIDGSTSIPNEWSGRVVNWSWIDGQAGLYLANEGPLEITTTVTGDKVLLSINGPVGGGMVIRKYIAGQVNDMVVVKGS